MTNIKLVVAGVLLVAAAAARWQRSSSSPAIRAFVAVRRRGAALEVSRRRNWPSSTSARPNSRRPTVRRGPRASFQPRQLWGGVTASRRWVVRARHDPQIAVATAFGARNTIPSFLTLDGPVREVRFKRHLDGTPDGGVHALFVISGRVDDGGDATACTISQPNFDRHFAAGNVIFRIPTPVFGAGWSSRFPTRILANLRASATVKTRSASSAVPRVRISGEPNNNGNDGTVARFAGRRRTSRCCSSPRSLQRRDGHHQRAVPDRA